MKKANNHQKTVLELSKRVQHMGLQHHPRVKFLFKLCRSPFQDVAFVHTEELTRLLDRMEFSNELYGNDTVPKLNPDTSIEIGTTERSKRPLRVSLKKVVHWLVSGVPGSGKTNLLFYILNQILQHGINVSFVDHKDEHGRLLANHPDAVLVPLDRQCWNPLCGVGNQADYTRYITMLLSRMMALHPVTSNAVRAKLLALCHRKDSLPSIRDLMLIFQKLAQKESRSSLHTAARGFEDLAMTFGRWADVRSGNWPFNHNLHAIPLKDVPPAIEQFYISILLKQLTDRASAHGHTTQPHHMLFFDEALSTMGKEFESIAGSGRTNPIAEMMRICRSYGIPIFAAVQALSNVQDAVLDNTSVFVAFRATNPQEAKLACERLGFAKSRHPEIMNLATGTAFAITPECNQAVKIKVPFVDLGDYPSQSETIAQMAPTWAKWESNATFSPAASTNTESLDFREILGEVEPPQALAETAQNTAITPEAAPTAPLTSPASTIPTARPILREYFELLHSAEQNPDFAATAHNETLGWSSRKGNRVKKKIIELGLAETSRVASSGAGRPKETLKLTEKGKGLLHEHA